MKARQYTFNFKGGPITVLAFHSEQAKILAKAEAIKRGWDDKIIEKTDNNLELVDKALMSIIEIFDTDTLDEQLDCIEALKKLRTKLKDKENTK